LNLPTGLSILPRGFADAKSKDDLFHESSSFDLIKLFKIEGAEVEITNFVDSKIPEIQENDFTLLLPCLAVTSMVMSENPAAVSVSLSIIANYATTFFKGITGKKTVRFDLVVESSKKKKTTKINYEGDPNGIEDLAKVIRAAYNGEN